MQIELDLEVEQCPTGLCKLQSTCQSWGLTQRLSALQEDERY